VPGETAHFVTPEYNRETESVFSLSPKQGVLLPHADHDFTLTYTPQEVWFVVPSYLPTPAACFYASHKTLAVQLCELNAISWYCALINSIQN